VIYWPRWWTPTPGSVNHRRSLYSC